MCAEAPQRVSALLFRVVQLGAQQGAQAGRAGAFAAGLLAQVGHGDLFVSHVLLLDRQLNVAGLAIHIDHHGRDFVAFLEHVAGIFHAVAGDFRSAQVTHDVFAEVDFSATGVHGLDLAGHRLALVVHRHEGREWVAVELLDAQRDAFAVHVHGQHDGFHFLALLVVTNCGFASFVPRQVRQVNQAVDAGSQAHEHAEVGDRLDRTLHAVAALRVLCEFLPWVGLALLHAQADTALVFVDFEDHDFDFVAQRNQLGGSDVLVGPVHFRHVHQAFDAGFEFDERAVVGNVRDLAEQAGALGVGARNAHPGVVAHLLEAQGHAVLLGVELEDLGGDFLTGRDHFRGVTHAAPCHVGDVQQAVDAAQVHERTVFGDVLDHALDDGAFFQGFHQLGAFFAHRGFHHGAAAQHHVVALAVELDDLEFHGLVFVRRQILDRTRIDQRAGQEGTDAVDQHGQAALDLAAGGAGDEFAGFQGLFQAHPRSQALGGVTRQDGVAVAVFDGANGHRHEVTHLDFDFALVVLELFQRHVGFGLEASVDHDEVVFHAHDFGGDDFAWAHFSALQGFFKKGGKRFRHVFPCHKQVYGDTIAAVSKAACGGLLCGGRPQVG